MNGQVKIQGSIRERFDFIYNYCFSINTIIKYDEEQQFIKLLTKVLLSSDRLSENLAYKEIIEKYSNVLEEGRSYDKESYNSETTGIIFDVARYLLKHESDRELLEIKKEKLRLFMEMIPNCKGLVQNEKRPFIKVINKNGVLKGE